jgi:hypothetical protein
MTEKTKAPPGADPIWGKLCNCSENCKCAGISHDSLVRLECIALAIRALVNESVYQSNNFPASTKIISETLVPAFREIVTKFGEGLELSACLGDNLAALALVIAKEIPPRSTGGDNEFDA